MTKEQRPNRSYNWAMMRHKYAMEVRKIKTELGVESLTYDQFAEHSEYGIEQLKSGESEPAWWDEVIEKLNSGFFDRDN